MNAIQKTGWLKEIDQELGSDERHLSYWCRAVIRDVDVAFVAGANLSAIMTAVAAIESHLRFDARHGVNRSPFRRLTIDLGLPAEQQAELQSIHSFATQWISGCDHGDQGVAADAHDVDRSQEKLEEMAKRAVRALREAIYLDQCV